MSSLAERQANFAQAIIDAQGAIPSGLMVRSGASLVERIAVYRNNVAVSLIEALRSAFPVVDQLVGGEFFSAMAHAHALETPPTSPVLLAFGDRFPEFIRGFEPAGELPYLADVACLEWLWLESHHASDAEPLEVGALLDLSAEAISRLRLEPHPSLRLACFAEPALTVWRHHQDADSAISLVLPEGPEYALVVRPRFSVSVIGLTIGAYTFVEHIRSGNDLSAAFNAALTAEPSLDLEELLQLLFAAGAFRQATLANQPLAHLEPWT